MAALCPGVQYGLSSQQNFGENKDLIFVKLTDSALRAIEDYIKNANKFSCQQRPTIKFLGNEGHLSFPSVQNGGTSFKFSMSTTADMEGPGGSFECVQQSAPPRGNLEVLGSIPYKMRVHANEDVYEATRHRMTIAEENHKNKCTREIKPNEKDIGRKVKLKQSRTSLPPSIRRDLGTSQRDNNNVNTIQKPSYPSNLSSSSSSSVTNNKLSPAITSNGLSNGLNSNQVNSSRLPPNKPSVPDIARRPVRERLIHLLALRPFKKVELHDRLTKEGLREKNGMSSILKQISFMKDNCYLLNRAVWNEVNEDWPFYTETERQILKRRKPQNLTPPGGSDGGSSGSGQSPTSTHPGSPPQMTSSSSSKRPGYYDGLDGLPTKRQRISHYRKTPPEQNYHTSSPIVENNNGQRRPVTDSRDASNMNPRSRESPPPNTNGYLTPNMTNGTGGSGVAYKNGRSPDERDRKQRNSGGNTGSGSFPCDNLNSLNLGVSRDYRPLSQSNNNYNKTANDTDRNGYSNEVVLNGKSRDKDRNRYEKVNSSWQDKSRGASVSPDSRLDLNGHHDDNSVIRINENGRDVKIDKTSEFPDYLTEYTTIKDAEQRRRYKAAFYSDYDEYKDLHGIVEKVSRRFAELELRLKQEDASSPRHKDIKRQIVREYNENKKDLEHQKAKRRFQYLHDKLSHIKRLVLEYDQSMVDNQY